MPAEPSPAVFLSYASQDAEAARHICEALRAAGVEVWFDQSELRGGDAWDQKIRRQIKDCALFVPVISTNTNARPEGYFRLEWKLAVDRSHLMADDQPFLMPVIIGETPEPSARVPDKFREVQWTRLRLDETPAEFSARVRTLLADAGASGAPAEETCPGGARRRSASKSKASFWWTKIVPLVGIAAGLFYALRPLWLTERRSADRPRAEMSSAATGGVTAEAKRPSEARQLALRARTMTLDKYSSGPDDFAAAEPLIKRALELDPTDAEILAISSLFNTAIGTRGFDHARSRRELARSHAERALSLAPDSIEGLYALGRWQRDNEPDEAVAESTFKKVLEREPEHIGAILTLAIHYQRRDRYDDALPYFVKAAARPETRALALYNMYLGYFARSRFVEAESTVRESIATEPSVNSQGGLALLLLTVKGDPEAAAQAVATGPAATRNEHRIIWITAYAHLLRRAPDDVLRTVARLSDDFIQDNWFVGPKSYWAGRAHALAGRKEAARIAWEAGLAVMRPKLAQDPENMFLRVMQAELLALLGREEEALREARAVEEMQRGRFWIWPSTPARVYATLGRADEALGFLRTADQRKPGETSGWPITAALLRMDPSWDPIRTHPKFVEKVAAAAAAELIVAPPSGNRVEAAPREKPTAVAVAAASGKSIAVLAVPAETGGAGILAEYREAWSQYLTWKKKTGNP